MARTGTIHTPAGIDVSYEYDPSDDEMTTYRFWIDDVEYLLPHTPHETPYWELMYFEDATEEYSSIAIGPEAVEQWLVARNMTGII